MPAVDLKAMQSPFFRFQVWIPLMPRLGAEVHWEDGQVPVRGSGGTRMKEENIGRWSKVE